MRIPRCNEAYVSIAKLQDYLLSKTHPVGRSKAKFFRSLGFDETKTALLEARLLAIVRSEDYVEVAPSPHGTKYVVERAIQTPRGDGVQIRTVWIIETGENRPRFVTAYPV
jgi:hypothetical protein